MDDGKWKKILHCSCGRRPYYFEYHQTIGGMSLFLSFFPTRADIFFFTLKHTRAYTPKSTSLKLSNLKIFICYRPKLHMHINAIVFLVMKKIYTRTKDSCSVNYITSFKTFFVQAFKLVAVSWKFSMLLLYILWDDWPIFMISASNEQLQQQLEYTLLKPNCHNWRCPWCNGYRRRKWTRRHEFKPGRDWLHLT